MNYVYIRSEHAGVRGAEHDLYTVGFYDPQGNWQSESDYSTTAEAAARVHYLNGGNEDILRQLDGAYLEVEDGHLSARTETGWQLWTRQVKNRAGLRIDFEKMIRDVLAEKIKLEGWKFGVSS